MQAVKVVVNNRRKRWFCMGPNFKGRGYPKFRTCIFKSHSLPNVSPVLLEFCSVSSLGSWRKKRRKKERRRMAVKPKSADYYVGRRDWGQKFGTVNVNTYKRDLQWDLLLHTVLRYCTWIVKKAAYRIGNRGRTSVCCTDQWSWMCCAVTANFDVM